MEPEYAILSGIWRRECPECLRTADIPSKGSQLKWFESLDGSNHKYWGCAEGDECVGVAGLTYISWENRSAEISLIIDPKLRGKGLGSDAVELLLEMAFYRMNLEIVYGEVYDCGNVEFWKKVAPPGMKWVTLPDRKFWNGKYYDSQYFSLRRSI
jgi:RimJ/RimL family protein N-acetyltransferase